MLLLMRRGELVMMTLHLLLPSSRFHMSHRILSLEFLFDYELRVLTRLSISFTTTTTTAKNMAVI